MNKFMIFKIGSKSVLEDPESLFFIDVVGLVVVCNGSRVINANVLDKAAVICSVDAINVLSVVVVLFLVLKVSPSSLSLYIKQKQNKKKEKKQENILPANLMLKNAELECTHFTDDKQTNIRTHTKLIAMSRLPQEYSTYSTHI